MVRGLGQGFGFGSGLKVMVRVKERDGFFLFLTRLYQGVRRILLQVTF